MTVDVFGSEITQPTNLQKDDDGLATRELDTKTDDDQRAFILTQQAVLSTADIPSELYKKLMR